SPFGDRQKSSNPTKVGRRGRGIIGMDPAAVGSGLGMSFGKFSNCAYPVPVGNCIVIKKCYQLSPRFPKSATTSKSGPLLRFVAPPQVRHICLKVGNHFLDVIAAVVVDDKNFPRYCFSLYLSLKLAKNLRQPGSAIVGRDGYCNIH